MLCRGPRLLLIRVNSTLILFNGSQLSNLWWMPNSISKGFDTAMKTGSSRWFKLYPTTYMWVSSWLPVTVDQGLSWFILILSKGRLAWNFTSRLSGIFWIVLMSLILWQCQNPCRLSLAFIIDWRVVLSFTSGCRYLDAVAGSLQNLVLLVLCLCFPISIEHIK